jgi:hypothetical protein
MADMRCYSGGVDPADASGGQPDGDNGSADADTSRPDADISQPDAMMSVADASTIDAPIDGPPGVCNPVTQNGCPGTQRCTYVAVSGGGSTQCVVAGSVSIGGMCTGTSGGTPDDCQAGGFCINGTCQPICSTSPDSCAANSICTQFTGVFSDVSGVGLCQPTCDPWLGTGSCGTGEACYFTASLGTGQCAGAGTLTENQACMFINHCVPGLACLVPDPVNPGGAVCKSYCDANGGSGQCGGGQRVCARLSENFSTLMSQPSNRGICVHCGDFPQLPACGGSQPF